MVGSADAGSGSGTLDTAKTISGSVTFKGDYNANTNSPNLDTSPSCVKKGDQYVVSVGGAAFFTESLQAGDSIIAKQDDPTTLAHWIRINSNLVTPIVATTCLSATGTKDATTFLRGDNTWATVSSGFTALADDDLNFAGLYDVEDLQRACFEIQSSSFDSDSTNNADRTNESQMYVRQIDSNNDGLFIRIKKNGSIQNLQIG